MGLEESALVLHAAREMGVTLFDTAQFYGDGMANRQLAAAFGNAADVVIASKVKAAPNPAGMPPMVEAQRPERRDHLDMVFMRRMDCEPGKRGHKKVPPDDQLAELVGLREEGLIGAIGLSHVLLEQAEAALPVGIAAVSNFYTMVQRVDEEAMKQCARRDAVARKRSWA